MRSVKNKPKTIGLTGGIASGKSTVANYLTKLGYLVFDSDNYVRDIWTNDLELINTVNNKYNIDISTNLGKKELRNIIFNNEEDKKYINSLIHPKVFLGVEKFTKNNSKEKILFIDMPLLFEVGYENNVDKTLLVYTNKNLQIERVINRDKISFDDANKIIDNQMSLELKKTLSDYILDNSKEIKDLYKEVDNFLERINNED